MDLFAGAGGCSAGYMAAGFHVTAVDTNPRALRHNPADTRVVADALQVLGGGLDLAGFVAVHASPPCQPYSRTRHLARGQGHPTVKPALLEPVMAALEAWGGLWVVENVPGSGLDGISLCGRAYGLDVKRHRLFSSNVPLMGAGCACGRAAPVGVYGRTIGDRIPGGGVVARDVAHGRAAMGVTWPMPWNYLREAIPPAYARHIGEQLLAQLAADAA